MNAKVAEHLESFRREHGAGPVKAQLEVLQLEALRHVDPAKKIYTQIGLVSNALLKDVAADRTLEQSLTRMGVNDLLKGQVRHDLERWLVYEKGLSQFRETEDASEVKVRLGLGVGASQELEVLVVAELGDAELAKGRSPEAIVSEWGLQTPFARKLLEQASPHFRPSDCCTETSRTKYVFDA